MPDFFPVSFNGTIGISIDYNFGPLLSTQLRSGTQRTTTFYVLWDLLQSLEL